MEKGAALPRPVLHCYQACYVAGGAEGNSRWFTAAAEAECRAISVVVIGAIEVQRDVRQ
jgi:hypothetical protein